MQRRILWSAHHFLFLSGKSSAPVLVHCSAGVGRWAVVTSWTPWPSVDQSRHSVPFDCMVFSQDRHLHSYPATYGDDWTGGNIWVNFGIRSMCSRDPWQSLTTVYFQATMCMGRCGGNAFCKAKDGPEKRTVCNLGVSSQWKATCLQAQFSSDI